jgi:outer membrane protein TolC/ABC-type transporter Mla MlaB component
VIKVTTERRRCKVTFKVEGRLAGDNVASLDQCWRQLKSESPQEKLRVDLCGVSFIDPSGKALLREIHQQGGQLVAEGCLNQAIVSEIVREESERRQGEKGGKKPFSKGSYIIFWGLLLGVLVPSVGRAQNQPRPLSASAPSGVLTLTLDQAVALALKQNTTAQISLITAAESVEDKNIARAALLPQAQFNMSEEWQRLNLRAQFGGSFPFSGPVPISIPGHIGPFGQFAVGGSFSGTVYDLTLYRRYKAAENTANASKFDAHSTREQVILLVVSQYIGTLRAMADVQASESRVTLAQALYDQAADLQKQGVGTGIDTLRANVELQNEKQRLIESVAQRETSLFGLSRLLNLDPRQQITLGDSLHFFDTPQPEMDSSIEEALAARPEWKALAEQIKAADYQKRAATASRLPSGHASANWTELGTAPDSVIPTYMYTGTVTMPLFTGGRIRAEIARANLEIQRVQQQQEDLRNQIALDVKTALINLESARSQVTVAELGMKLSTEEVDQARDRFKAGVANNVEVVQAQDALARANDNQIAALYSFNQARADLARAIGQMEKLYAK